MMAKPKKESWNKKYQDEESCREFLVQQRWNGIPKCPYCSCEKSYKIEGGKRFKCANPECWKKYSVTVGTIFEASKIPLTTWFEAVYVITAHKKGISSCQLARNLRVTQKTGWFMLHRIREALKENAPLLLQKEVQADEVYLGGEEKNKHKDKRTPNSQGKSQIKIPVVGLIETGGRVVTQVMSTVTKKDITEMVETHLDKNAILVSDSNPVYYRVGRKFDHVIVNHSKGQFKVGVFHTNSIENYWSILTRTITGTYHQLSTKHLQRYCEESAFRFNSRKLPDGFRWQITFQQIEGRLTYKQLIHGKGEENNPGKEVQTIETGE